MLNSANVSWDEKGNLKGIYTGLNLLEIIRMLGDSRAKIPDSQKKLIQFLLTSTNLPPSAIRNKRERLKLVGEGGGIKSRRRRKGRIDRGKKRVASPPHPPLPPTGSRWFAY